MNNKNEIMQYFQFPQFITKVYELNRNMGERITKYLNMRITKRLHKWDLLNVYNDSKIIVLSGGRKNLKKFSKWFSKQIINQFGSISLPSVLIPVLFECELKKSRAKKDYSKKGGDSDC